MRFRSTLLAFVASSIAFAQAPIEPPVAVPASSELTHEEEADEEESPGAATPFPEGVVPPTAPPPGTIALSASRVMEFQGDDFGLVLRTLARQSILNVVVSASAAKAGGTVTMRLEDRTPREAMEVIVHDKGLVIEEINGVYFIKTKAELASEPAAKKLERLTTSIVEPLGKLKGEYYRQLVQSGVPEATAASVILNEEISKSAFENSPVSSHASEQSGGDSKDWVAWSVVGATGLELMQRMPLLLLHFIFAISVWATARRAQRSGVTLTYLSPFFWGFATLIGGVLVAGLYWVIHHSSLRLNPEQPR